MMNKRCWMPSDVPLKRIYFTYMVILPAFVLYVLFLEPGDMVGDLQWISETRRSLISVTRSLNLTETPTE